MAPIRELGIDHAKLNVNGGACALGHPIGASGARLVVTLVHAMQQRGLRRGVAALCIGGGEATALAIELLGHFTFMLPIDTGALRLMMLGRNRARPTLTRMRILIMLINKSSLALALALALAACSGPE